MVKAAKDFSLGSEELSRGDVIPAELQKSLPVGRMEALRTQRFVEEFSDEQRIEELLADLNARVEKLERAIKPRRVGRPKKAA